MATVIFSVIVPCFNEQEVLPITHQRLTAVMQGLGEEYELIYVDDGSRDETLPILRRLHEEDPHAVVVSFSRNFGQQYAITAGLHAARGQAIVLIDADLQDPPEVIPAMVEKWREGADVVYGKRLSRAGETFFKKFTSKAFYRVFSALSETKAPLDTGDFRLMDRKVVRELDAMGEHNRYLRGMVSWVGFKQEAVEFERQERLAGETKWGTRQMISLANDGLIGFSKKPLKIATRLGILLSAGSFIWTLVALILLLFNYDITGITFAFCGLFFVAGLLFICMGLLGTYIGRIYDETKNRPNYIVNEFLRRKPLSAEPVAEPAMDENPDEDQQ